MSEAKTKISETIKIRLRSYLCSNIISTIVQLLGEKDKQLSSFLVSFFAQDSVVRRAPLIIKKVPEPARMRV
jgi:hypothetical protein